MTKEHTPPETLLTFPCDFTLKILGKQSPEFEAAVYMIVHQHVPRFADTLIQTRPSAKGQYLALSVSVHVDSKEQLDNLYIALTGCPHVIMVL